MELHLSTKHIAKNSGNFRNQQPSSKLIEQMKNNPLGNTGTIKDAKDFRTTMDREFLVAIPPENPLKQSIPKSSQIQQKCFTQMEQGIPPSLDEHDLSHFNEPLPKHLHLSFFGTLEHSVDLVFTKTRKEHL